MSTPNRTENERTEGASTATRADELRGPARFAEHHLYLVEGISDFIYDEGQDLFRFPEGRFAFSKAWADVRLLQERGYFG